MIDMDIQTIEPMIESLVRQYGIEAVNNALVPLMKNWGDWQRVAGAAKRGDAKIKRQCGRKQYEHK